MARLFNPQTNFTTGLVDKHMLGRHDTKVYTNGAAELKNWIQMAQGGVKRRPGFRRTHDFQKPSTERSYRLIPFVFNESQTYIICLSSNGIEIFSSAGALIQTIAAPTGWGDATLSQIRWTQRADTMIFANTSFFPQVLKRTGATTFTLTTFAFELLGNERPTTPLLKLVGGTVQVTPSNATGAGNLVASTSVFSSSHVGAQIRVGSGYVLVSGFTSATTVAYTRPWETSSIGTSATADWAESALGFDAGNPRAVAFHGQRLWFSGSSKAPAHVFGSKSSDFFNFDVGTGLDDESVQAAAASNQVNEISHITSMDKLYIMTDAGINFVPETDESPVTPSTLNFRGISAHGATANIDPIIYDDTVLYTQIGQKAIRKVHSDEFTNRVKNDSVSLVTHEAFSEMTDSAVIDVFPDRPEHYAYFTMNNGQIAVYHAIATENLQGWSIWTAPSGGSVKTIAAIADKLFAVIEFPLFLPAIGDTAASVRNTQILCLLDNTVTLDASQVVTSGSAVGTFTLNDNYRDKTVDVVSDSPDDVENGFYLGTVATHQDSGATKVTLPGGNTSTRIVVGFSYDASLKMLPPIYELDNGVQFSEPKRIVSANLELVDTLSVAVEGIPIIARQAADDPANAPSLINGQQKVYNLGWDRRGEITMTVPEPLDATLLSVTREVAF